LRISSTHTEYLVVDLKLKEQVYSVILNAVQKRDDLVKFISNCPFLQNLYPQMKSKHALPLFKSSETIGSLTASSKDMANYLREWTLYNNLKQDDPKEQYWIQYKNFDPVDIMINPNALIQQLKKEITASEELMFVNIPTSRLKLSKEDRTVLKPQDRINTILKPQDIIIVEILDETT